jgi:hypothetical protein
MTAIYGYVGSTLPRRESMSRDVIGTLKRQTMKDKDYLLETIKVIALVAIAVELFCLVYAIWPMIPIYD